MESLQPIKVQFNNSDTTGEDNVSLVELEVIADPMEGVDARLMEIDAELFSLSGEIANLTNQATKLDYTVAVASGVIAGLIDIFFVGKFDLQAGHEWSTEKVNSFVEHVAKKQGYMVNMVGEQGTYWVANNFIWGWMLLPITQLGELIKQETATDEKAVNNNSLGYFSVTAIVCALWAVLIPTYKPFMQYILGYADVDKLFGLVMVLFAFYILYAFQNVFDCTFYGRGKTNYMLFESVVTNSVYYGTFFVLYLTGAWTPTLIGIALMFGIGNAFDSIVSGAAYAYFLKKNKYNIFDVK